MLVCPHCHQPIEVAPRVKVSFWRHDLTPGLGCGSLLAIAIIVAMCSGGLRHSDEIGTLRDEVKELAGKVDLLTETVRAASSRSQAPAPQP
jgi:hypothetical protein